MRLSSSTLPLSSHSIDLIFISAVVFALGSARFAFGCQEKLFCTGPLLVPTGHLALRTFPLRNFQPKLRVLLKLVKYHISNFDLLHRSGNDLCLLNGKFILGLFVFGNSLKWKLMVE